MSSRACAFLDVYYWLVGDRLLNSSGQLILAGSIIGSAVPEAHWVSHRP